MRPTPSTTWPPLFAAALIAAALAANAARAQGGSQPVAAPQEPRTGHEAPLGIALEGFAYPHPVRYLALVEGGQRLRLGYMDVPPTGAANGRAVLLLHGRNFPSSYWPPTIAALAAADYRLVVPDQIGFGKSSKPALAYSFDMMARNTDLLLGQLGLDRVSVVGHSMGGMLAARLTRTFPGRVERLALVAPIGLEDYRLFVPPVPDERLLEQERGLTADAYRRQLVTSYSLALPPESIEPFVAVRERVKGSGEYERWLTAFVASYQMIWGQPVVHEIPLIQQPTLFLMGERDRNAPGRAYAPPEQRGRMGDNAGLARALAARMPRARAVVFEGIGHLPHMESEVNFNHKLMRFLND